MDILHLIDRLEEIATDARRLPVGGGVVDPDGVQVTVVGAALVPL